MHTHTHTHTHTQTQTVYAVHADITIHTSTYMVYGTCYIVAHSGSFFGVLRF